MRTGRNKQQHQLPPPLQSTATGPLRRRSKRLLEQNERSGINAPSQPEMSSGRPKKCGKANVQVDAALCQPLVKSAHSAMQIRMVRRNNLTHANNAAANKLAEPQQALDQRTESSKLVAAMSITLSQLSDNYPNPEFERLWPRFLAEAQDHNSTFTRYFRQARPVNSKLLLTFLQKHDKKRLIELASYLPDAVYDQNVCLTTRTYRQQERDWFYIGQINQTYCCGQQIYHGQGLWQNRQGIAYIGTWDWGRMHGHGALYLRNQLCFEGEFHLNFPIEDKPYPYKQYIEKQFAARVASCFCIEQNGERSSQCSQQTPPKRQSLTTSTATSKRLVEQP